MNNQTNDTLYIVRKRPPVDWVSSPMELTFHNEYNFNKWFAEEASCHATWNKKKSTISTAAPSTLFTKDTPSPKKKLIGLFCTSVIIVVNCLPSPQQPKNVEQMYQNTLVVL